MWRVSPGRSSLKLCLNRARGASYQLTTWRTCRPLHSMGKCAPRAFALCQRTADPQCALARNIHGMPVSHTGHVLRAEYSRTHAMERSSQRRLFAALARRHLRPSALSAPLQPATSISSVKPRAGLCSRYHHILPSAMLRNVDCRISLRVRGACGMRGRSLAPADRVDWTVAVSDARQPARCVCNSTRNSTSCLGYQFRRIFQYFHPGVSLCLDGLLGGLGWTLTCAWCRST